MKYVVAILIVYVLYQFGSGVYDSNYNEKSSLMYLGIKASGKDPVSREIYLLGVHTNPEVQKRINNIQSRN